MKLALISDIHLGSRLDSKLYLDNILLFLSTKFIPYLQDNGIDTVLMLGDIWDKRKIINVNTLHRCKTEFFDVLESLGINVVVIYGNHDVVYKNTNSVNSINSTLGQYSNVKIIKGYEVINFDGMNIAFTSWITTDNKKQTLEWIETVNADVLMGHFEVGDFIFPDATVYRDSISTNLFRRFEYVFSGHYHIRSNNGHFFYIGNPSETTWSDYGIKKGFHIFDTATRDIQFIENPYTLYNKIQYTDDIDISSFPYDDYTNKIVMVYIKSITGINIQKYNLFLDKLSGVVSSYETSEQTDTTERDSEELNHLYKISDTEELITQYIDSVFSTIENIDKISVQTYIMSLYKQAVGGIA